MTIFLVSGKISIDVRFGERRPIAIPDKQQPRTYAATKKRRPSNATIYTRRITNHFAAIGSDIHVGRVRDVYTFTLGSAEDSLFGDIGPVVSHDEVEARK